MPKFLEFQVMLSIIMMVKNMKLLHEIDDKNTICDGGSTALYTTYTVNTVNTIYTVYSVYSVYTVSTVFTI